MIERLYDRIVATPEIDNVILATTNLKSDNKLVEWAKTKGIDFYRGSSNDVLGRITAAAENFKLKNIVEILGDNPLVHSDLISSCIRLHSTKNSDYTATLTNEYSKASNTSKKFP